MGQHDLPGEGPAADPSPAPEARITLVIPTFERPALLRQTLQSVQAQTMTDFVALVCDNSPGREGEPVVAALDDPRFRYHPRPRNLGILGNAIAGFQAATSPLVMEVDDDDLLYPDCLAQLTAPFAADPELTVAFGDVDVIGWDGAELDEERRAQFLPVDRGLREGRYQPFTDLAARGWVYLFAAVLRRDAIDWHAVPRDTGGAYDRHLSLAAARGGRAAYFVDRVVMSYRVHADADGVRHEADQLHGAIRALERELPYVTGPDEVAVRRELVKRRLMHVRAVGAEQGARRALASARPLADPATLRRASELVVRDYLPVKVASWRKRLQDRDGAWRRQRGRAGQGL